MSTDESRTAAAFAAAREGNISYFQSLPDEELKVLCRKKDEDGRSLLHWACTSGNVDIVRLSIEKSEPSTRGAQDEDGLTPLMSASSCGHEQVVKILLDAGANVDQANSGGRTSLFYAASKGKQDVVQLLLQAGACTTIKDCTGAIPLHRATGAGRLEALRVLLQAKPRHMIDARDKAGATPWMVAMEAGHAAAARMLVEHGACVVDEVG